MDKEMIFKKIKDVDNPLSAFVNTVYNEFINEIDNIKEEMKTEKEPLHYLLLATKLQEVEYSLRMFERVVDDSTEFVEVANVSK